MDSVSLGMSLVQITWLNLLLSGDNALVIALACRELQGRQRRLGIILGAGAAVALRIIFTAGVSYILAFPFLRAGGAVLLLWIAVKLVLEEEGAGEGNIKGHSSLWRAVWTVVVADIVMSLDNVLAIAAAARGSQTLIIVGLAISVPIVIMGSTLIVNILNRMPLLVWAGAGFLGWIAGEMFAADEAAMAYAPFHLHHLVLPVVFALFVLGVGWLINRWHERSHAAAASHGSPANSDAPAE